MDKERIRIFGQADCYGLTKDLSFTLRLIYAFKDPIVKDDIESALRDLEKRFSYLKVSLKKDFKGFYYVRNPRPFVVQETEDPITLNGEESNGHLLSFSYYGTRLYINVYHGQMDGTGVYRLGKALVYYYCLRRYGSDLKVDDVARLDDQIEDEETCDGYKRFYRETKHAKWTKLKSQRPNRNIMILSDLDKAKPNKRTVMRIMIPQKDLMGYCSSYDGSPVTAVALMLADAIKSVHKDVRQNIVIGIPVNLRPALGLTKNQGNLWSRIHLEYTDQLQKKEFELQGTICRGTIIRYSDHALLRKNTYKYCRMLSLLNAIPIRKLKQILANLEANKMKRCETADVTYVGRCLYGDMEKYIDSMYLDIDCYGLGLMLLLSAIGDKFFISFDQDWEDKTYAEAFLKVLDKRNISYKVESFSHLSTAKMLNIL